MFALVLEGKVVDVVKDKFPTPKIMRWIECEDQVQIGWVYVDKKFRPNLLSDEENLESVKKQKISQLKIIRDQKNTEPITNHKAFLLDDEGNRTSEESYFLFYTNRHQSNPTSDPDSIINRSLESGMMPYFTKDLQGNPITVELNEDIAKSLRQSIAARNDQNYRKCCAIEAAIRSSVTVKEVEAIQIPTQFSN
jgi:hypothetical protein